MRGNPVWKGNMQIFQKIPIKQKLTFIIMIITSISLLLTVAALFVHDVITFKKKMIENVSVLAQAIGSNGTAALAVGDRQAAAEILEALRVKKYILSAAILSKDGKLFSTYHRDVKYRNKLNILLKSEKRTLASVNLIRGFLHIYPFPDSYPAEMSLMKYPCEL